MEYLNKNHSLQNYLSKIQYLFFILFILCIPFQDFGLQGTFLGFFGINLSNIPLVVLIFISVIEILLGKKYNKKDFIFYISLLIYIIGYSLCMLLIYINDSYVDVYIYKIFSNVIILIFWLSAYIYTKKYVNKIGKYIVSANIIHIIGWILCDILKLDLGKIIHYSRLVEYNRFSGFTGEASWFCFTAVLLGLLSIYYVKNKILRLVFCTLIIVFVIFGGSKGTLICMLLTFFFYIILNKKYNNIMKIIMLLGIILISFLGVYYILLNSFILDLEESTSFASRASSIISVFYILKDYPLGTGLGIFLPVFSIAIIKAFDLLNEYIPLIILNFEEIGEWLNNKDGINATVKNIVFQFVAYFGIPFLVVFIYYVRYIIKNIILYDKYLWLFIFIIIGLLTFANFNYDSIVALAIISCEIKKRKQIK